MWLLVIAAFGMLVPNGIFLYWLLTEFDSFNQFFTDRLALGFILDVIVATGVLTYLVAVKRLGPVRWPWFVLLSLLGGLGFSIPFYLWLNWRKAALPGTSFDAWWRAA
jgi:hypothetical protein